MVADAPTSPVTVLFTASDLPLFRDGMAGLHPLPAAFLQRPCWVHRLGLHPSEALFTALPEGPVDPEVHPHFWAMLTDVAGVITDDAALRRRILDADGHGPIALGYHASADDASVRAYYRARGPVIDAHTLAAAPDPAPIPAPDADATLRALDARLRVAPGAPPVVQALRRYLHGAKGPPPKVPPGALPDLGALFRDVSPRAFNDAHLRLLDVLAAPRGGSRRWSGCSGSGAPRTTSTPCGGASCTRGAWATT